MTKIGGHSDGARADGISRVPASGPHTETPVPAEQPDHYVLTIYEPRWHGFAQWVIESRFASAENIYVGREVERGWTRRKRGSRCLAAVSQTEHWTRYFATGKASNEC